MGPASGWAGRRAGTPPLDQTGRGFDTARPITPPGRSSRMFSRPNSLTSSIRVACLAGLGVGVAWLAGCETSPFSAGPERTAVQRRQAFPTPSDAYAKIGYRLDWVGYPAITGSL